MVIAIGAERCKELKGVRDSAAIYISEKANVAGIISCEPDLRSYNFMDTQWESAGNSVVGSTATLCHGQFWSGDAKTPPPPGILAKIAAFFGSP